MKATRELPPTYRPGEEFNLGNYRTVLLMNIAGLAALLLFGWLFLQLAYRLRPEYPTANLRLVVGGLNLLSFFLTLAVTMILHELVHRFFFWRYSGARPKFGFNILYAYAAAPGWYFPRNQFMWVGLAPLIVLSLAGVALLPVVPFVWVPPVILALILNAAGAVGDIWVVGWLAGRPRESFIQDRGPAMQIFLPQREVLAAQWQALLSRFGISAAEAAAAFDRLAAQYQTGERYYHTLLHVQDVLRVVDQLADFAADPEVVRLAAWYHDAVYDTHRPDNEAQSAAFAVQELAWLGLSEEIISEVERLILLTADYNQPTWAQAGRDDRNAHVLLDADLAGLAAPWAEFQEKAENIRREFAWVAEATYRAERRAILQKFLDRERIYFTPRLFALSEQQARENIRREQDRLAAKAAERMLLTKT